MRPIIDIAYGGKARFRSQTNPPRALYGWCQAFQAHSCAEHEGSERNITWYGSAEAAANRSSIFTRLVNDSNIEIGDSLYWTGVTDGHVAYCVGRQNGRNLVVHTGVRASDWVADLGNDLRISHADTMGIPFLGASKRNGANPPIYGIPWRTDTPVLAPHERQVGSVPARRRAQPTTQSAIAGDPLEAHETGEFDGWINGEVVDGNPVWFRGLYSKNWFHSGGFTNPKTDGLADLNVAAPSNVRPTSEVSRIRTEPSTTSAVAGEYALGESVTILGWAKGQLHEGIDVWFKSDRGWIWAGNFANRNTSALTDLNAEVPPILPDFVPFEAFSDVVTEVIPAHTTKYEVGNFPASPDGVILHDFGADGINSYESVINTFKNANAREVSAHFVVSGSNIIQCVDLTNRAYHAGPKGNHLIGIEVDPAVGRAPGDPLREQTIASVKRLLKALSEHYGKQLGWHKHDEFVATGCGDDIDFADYVDADDPAPPIVDPGLGEQISGLSKLIQQLIDLLKSIFKIGG